MAVRDADAFQFDDPFVRWCIANHEKMLQSFRFDRKKAGQVMEDGLLGGQQEIEAYDAGGAPWCITYTFMPDELEGVIVGFKPPKIARFPHSFVVK